jgi:hypothetical protein
VAITVTYSTAQQQATIPATTIGTGKGTGQLPPQPPRAGHGYRDAAHNKFRTRRTCREEQERRLTSLAHFVLVATAEGPSGGMYL